MYELYIANKNYSSWSLRPWVLMKTLGIEFEERLVPFERDDNFEQFRVFSPNGKVPCLVHRGSPVWDSLGIAEYLAEQVPDVWPADVDARTFARCATAEMHSGFSTLRNVCPMICALNVELNEITPALRRDINRIDELWRSGLEQFGGKYLAGENFSAVDAFYCPVAFRVQTYGLPLSAASLEYCQTLLSLPAMQAWEAAGIAEPWREQSHEEDVRRVGRVVRDRRT